MSVAGGRSLDWPVLTSESTCAEVVVASFQPPRPVS